MTGLCFALGLAIPRASDDRIQLLDVALDAGLAMRNVHGDTTKDYIIDANGNGAAWFDYDNDGDIDALLVNGSTREQLQEGGSPMIALFRNDGFGRFTDVTKDSGIDSRGWGMGVCVADYDNDGARDVYVTALGSNMLLRNDGDGTFEDVTAAAGVGDTRWSTNCAFGDYDRDGDVDLYVANHVAFDQAMIPPREAHACRHEDLDVYCGPRGLPGEPDVLYRNNGDGTFTDVAAAAGVESASYYGFSVLFSDLDDDGWPDIFVADDSLPNLWFHNAGDGTFVEEGLPQGLALNDEGREQAAMGADAGDFDGDGRLDLVVTNFSEDYNTLYRNDGSGGFRDVSYQAGLGTASWWRLGWGVGFVDFDNDRRLDLFVANGHVYPDVGTLKRGTTYRQRNQLFRNVGGGRFTDVSAHAGPGLEIAASSRGAAFGDFDNDGDIDVLVVNMNDRPTLLRNDTAGGHWVTIRLTGTTANRDAIGARIRVTAGHQTQVAEIRSGGSYLSHNDLRAHFGLADVTAVERVAIRWPDGKTEAIDGLEADRFYEIREGTGRAVVLGP